MPMALAAAAAARNLTSRYAGRLPHTRFGRLYHSSYPPRALAFEELLATTTSTPNGPVAFVFHGLLGSGRNWRSFSKNLITAFLNSSPSTCWKFFLVDLRNHGNSAKVEHLDPPHNLVNAAADVANLVKFQGLPWPDVVVGHSFGGKVALQFAQDLANGSYGPSAVLPKQVWTLDSVIGELNSGESSTEVEKVLEVLQNIPLPIPSRQWLMDHLLEHGFSRTLSHWLGTNLNTEREEKTWVFNLEGAVQMLNSYRKTAYWSLLENPPVGIDFEIVRAEKSDRWEPGVIKRLESLAARHPGPSEGQVSVHVLPNAGHWVHVDNPIGLHGIMFPKLASLTPLP